MTKRVFLHLDENFFQTIFARIVVCGIVAASASRHRATLLPGRSGTGITRSLARIIRRTLGLARIHRWAHRFRRRTFGFARIRLWFRWLARSRRLRRFRFLQFVQINSSRDGRFIHLYNLSVVRI